MGGFVTFSGSTAVILSQRETRFIREQYAMPFNGPHIKRLGSLAAKVARLLVPVPATVLNATYCVGFLETTDFGCHVPWRKGLE
ncbi:hypothetical protein TNCV_2193511 [Trichonephila clavipes]|nr:hypothetical protein TNCV_2193511 [Trichonephila clavipes]